MASNRHQRPDHDLDAVFDDTDGTEKLSATHAAPMETISLNARDAPYEEIAFAVGDDAPQTGDTARGVATGRRQYEPVRDVFDADGPDAFEPAPGGDHTYQKITWTESLTGVHADDDWEARKAVDPDGPGGLRGRHGDAYTVKIAEEHVGMHLANTVEDLHGAGIGGHEMTHGIQAQSLSQNEVVDYAHGEGSPLDHDGGDAWREGIDKSVPLLGASDDDGFMDDTDDSGMDQ